MLLKHKLEEMDSMKQLQHDSIIPLYHQLKEILKDSVDNGNWNTGDKVPSENQLMEEYGVSRNTVKKRSKSLFRMGFV